MILRSPQAVLVFKASRPILLQHQPSLPAFSYFPLRLSSTSVLSSPNFSLPIPLSLLSFLTTPTASICADSIPHNFSTTLLPATRSITLQLFKWYRTSSGDQILVVSQNSCYLWEFFGIFLERLLFVQDCSRSNYRVSDLANFHDLYLNLSEIP